MERVSPRPLHLLLTSFEWYPVSNGDSKEKKKCPSMSVNTNRDAPPSWAAASGKAVAPGEEGARACVCVCALVCMCTCAFRTIMDPGGEERRHIR